MQQTFLETVEMQCGTKFHPYDYLCQVETIHTYIQTYIHL